MIELNRMRDALGALGALATGTPRFYRAPASLTLLGDHVEASGGFALCIATDRPIVVAAAGRNDRTVRVHSINDNTTAEFELDAAPPKQDDISWLADIRRATLALANLGIAIGGADLALRATIPAPASLTYASALALAAGSDAAVEPVDLARAIARESGMHAGPLATALGQRDHALLVDCRSDEATLVPFAFERAALVVCDPHVSSAVSPGLLRMRQTENIEAVALLQAKLPKIKTLRDVSLADFLRYGDVLSPTLKRRTRHVVTENVRVLQAVAAIRAQDAEALGGHLNESHESLRDDFEVSTPELDVLVAAARDHPGVYGARMSGNSRATTTIVLIERGALPAFRSSVTSIFRDTFGREPTILEVRTADAAACIG